MADGRHSVTIRLELENLKSSISMKTLSVRQPWAWLIVAGLKDIENRTWTTTYRGALLIHAAVTLDAMTEIERRFQVAIDHDALQFGGIIGRVELLDIVSSSHSRWFTGPYGWVLSQPQHLPFRHVRGQLGLFEVPD